MQRTAWWTLTASIAAPLLLVAGWTIGAAVQPTGYDPVRDTISALAGAGARDRWLMTGALAGLGFCYLLIAAGLHPTPLRARAVLASGGVATVLVAAFPQPVRGNSLAHTIAAIVAFVALGTWPAIAADQRATSVLLRRAASLAVSAALLGLVIWFALELHAGQRGLAERSAATAQSLWPLLVVVSIRRSSATP